MTFAGAGIDGLQFDKIPALDLKRMVENVRRISPKLIYKIFFR